MDSGYMENTGYGKITKIKGRKSFEVQFGRTRLAESEEGKKEKKRIFDKSVSFFLEE